jgi:transposase-like protein
MATGSLTPLLNPVHQKIIDMAMNGVGCRATARTMGWASTPFSHLKTLAAVETSKASSDEPSFNLKQDKAVSSK